MVDVVYKKNNEIKMWFRLRHSRCFAKEFSSALHCKMPNESVAHLWCDIRLIPALTDIQGCNIGNMSK